MKARKQAFAFLLSALSLIAQPWTHCTAQQISPVDLLMHPDKFKGAISGIGSGNANSLQIQTAGVSAQGAFEFMFGTHETSKGNLLSFPIIVRYNILNSSRIVSQDSFNVRNIAFVDNNQIFNLGFRIRNLHNIGADRFLLSLLTDYSYSTFVFPELQGSDLQFDTHSLMLGFHFGGLIDSDVAQIGITASPNASFLAIDNKAPNSFKQAVGASRNVADNFFGFGGRLLMQFNDFSFFFDLKKYMPLGSSANITGFTDEPIISFGGNAMGSILKFKKKD